MKKSSFRALFRHALLAASLLSASALSAPAPSQAASPTQLQSLLAQEAAGRGVDRAQALRYAADDPAAHWHAGEVQMDGRWVAIDELRDTAEDRKLQEYLELRERTSDDVAGHRLLANWAKKRGLPDQATAHWNAVLSIDPSDAAAREALGHRNVGSVWFTPEEVAKAEAAQRRQLVVLKKWMPQMRRLAKMLQSRNPETKLAAVEELENLDADAAIALEHTALQVGDDAAMPIVAALGRMRSEEACTSLVNIALADPTSKSGRAAAAALKEYDPHFYAPDLLGLLQAPTQVQVKKMYTRNGDLVLHQVYLSETRDAKYEQTVRKLVTINGNTSSPTQVDIASARDANRAGVAIQQVDETFRPLVSSGGLRSRQADLAVDSLTNLSIERSERVVAEQNRQASDRERRVKLVLSHISGVPAEASVQEHWQWWPSYNERGTGYNKPIRRTSIDDYSDPVDLRNTPVNFNNGTSYECLVPGTLIQTSCGLKPVESIKVGDMVPAVDIKTGETSLKPINLVNSRTAERTFVIRSAAGEAVESTGGHRWWILGEGWVRTRDLKPGMLIRTAQASVEVAAIEPSEEDKQVFNLIVDGSHTYFVGKERWLSWDVTELEPTVLTVPGFHPHLASR